MVFNIGSQQGNISNVAGDQTNYGNQGVNIAVPSEIVDATRQLISHLGDLQMSTQAAASAKTDLESLERDMTTVNVSKKQVARRLTQILSVTRDAGATIEASSKIGTAVTTIARWLGPIGSTLLGMLL